jgi:hypothetical protein
VTNCTFPLYSLGKSPLHRTLDGSYKQAGSDGEKKNSILAGNQMSIKAVNQTFKYAFYAVTDDNI